MTRYLYLIICFSVPMLSACTDSKGTYPELMPTEQLLAGPKLSTSATHPAATTENLESKADALRARAEALRKPVIEPATRNRMQR